MICSGATAHQPAVDGDGGDRRDGRAHLQLHRRDLGMSPRDDAARHLTLVSVHAGDDGNLVKTARTLGARGGQALATSISASCRCRLAAAGALSSSTALGFFITPALLGESEARRDLEIHSSRSFKETPQRRFASASRCAAARRAIVLALYVGCSACPCRAAPRGARRQGPGRADRAGSAPGSASAGRRSSQDLRAAGESGTGLGRCGRTAAGQRRERAYYGRPAS